MAVVVSLLASAAIALGSRIALGLGGMQSDIAERRWSAPLLAAASGALLTAVVLDFLPDAWEAAGSRTPWGILAGVMALWAVSAAVDWAFSRAYGPSAETRAPLSAASAVVLAASLSIHSLLEGASLAVMARDLSAASAVWMAAMLLHKLPEGLLWGLALTSALGWRTPGRGNRPSLTERRRLHAALLVPAACTFAGTAAGALVLRTGEAGAGPWMAAGLAGVLLYIALAELLPAMRDHARGPATALWFLAGAAAMLIPIWLSGAAGS
ncbi:MAG: ZIP family metal transporter [Alicyclobacillus sp.]|nr:ZIP family metal transporter [Alicyclobacillus sp.]